MVRTCKKFPPGKFRAINLFGIIIIKEEVLSSKPPRVIYKMVNHESIHTAQMRELLYFGFYIIYGIEWLYWAVFRTEEAYRHINFEKEAFSHEGDDNYLKTRKHFAQWRKKEA